MRKIIIVSLALFLSIGCITPAFGEEGAFPQSDFFLYLGVRNPGAGISAERIERILFSSAHIDVKGGKIVSDRLIPINFTKGIQDFTGTASIKMDGDYDKTDGRPSGTFSITEDMKDVWHGDVADVPSTWIDTMSGTFNGQVVGDKVVIRYKGKTAEEAHLGMADGSVKDESLSYDYSSVVAWRLNDYVVPEPPKISDLDKEFLDKYGKATDSGGRFYMPKGQIEIHIPGEPEDSWHSVDPLTAIPYGAQIKTDEDSEAIISFKDGTTYMMKPESTIIISGPPGERSLTKLVAGNIWVNIKKMVKDGSMEIDLNQAVAGIKGTTLVASVQGDKSTFKVIEGKISVTAKNSDESIEITGGQTATVDSAGKIEKESFDILEEQNTWDNPEKIDFAALEKMIPPEQAQAAPAAETRDASPSPSPAAAGGNSQNQTTAIAIFGGIVIAGAILALVLRKKK